MQRNKSSVSVLAQNFALRYAALVGWCLSGCVQAPAEDSDSIDFAADSLESAVDTTVPAEAVLSNQSLAVKGVLTIGSAFTRVAFPLQAGLPQTSYHAYVFLAGERSRTRFELGSTDDIQSVVQVTVYGPLGPSGWPTRPVFSRFTRTTKSFRTAALRRGTYVAVVARHSSSPNPRGAAFGSYNLTMTECSGCTLACAAPSTPACPTGSYCSGPAGSSEAQACLAQASLWETNALCGRPQDFAMNCSGIAMPRGALRVCVNGTHEEYECRQTGGFCNWVKRPCP